MSEMNHSDFTALADDEVAVCKSCDSAAVAICNTGSIPGPDTSGSRYKCDRCGEKFDSFAVRERHASGGGSSLVAKLCAADASEVSR